MKFIACVSSFNASWRKLAFPKSPIAQQDHVFAALPMGFGNIFIYQLAPMVTEKMGCN